VIVDHLGYSAAFLTFGAAACVALAALFLAMPETAPNRDAEVGAIRVSVSRIGAGTD
jgi:predicted MFS family arabinose efflux permease